MILSKRLLTNYLLRRISQFKEARDHHADDPQWVNPEICDIVIRELNDILYVMQEHGAFNTTKKIEETWIPAGQSCKWCKQDTLHASCPIRWDNLEGVTSE